MAEAIDYGEVFTYLQRVEAIHYASIAGIALLVFDYILTFDSEVLLIWTSRWNTVKVLLLLTRYMPFVDAIGVVIYLSMAEPENERCTVLYRFLGWWTVAGLAVVEILLTMRIWAVWENSNLILSMTTLLYLATWGGICVFMAGFLGAVKFAAPPPALARVGCLNVGANRDLSICWILIGLYDLAILFLLVVKAWPAFRKGGAHRITRTLYTDGLIYYVYLFVLSCINATVILSLPTVFVNLLTVLERVMYSILTCRAILHVRKQQYKEQQGDLTSLIHHMTCQWTLQ